MSSGTGIKQDVARLLIEGDLAFSRRFLERVVKGTGETVIPIFCMNSYLSLIIHESFRTLKVNDPGLAASLAYEHEETIERARLSVKLFDDSKNGLDKVGDTFARIIDEGRQAFLGNTWFPPARRWETDLGEYRYRGRLVSTTHTVGFVMALRVDALQDFATLGQELSAVAQAQSAYVSQAAGHLAWPGPSFMNSINLDAFETRDRRSERHFNQIFGPGLPEKMKASLTAFQCFLNVLDVMLRDDDNPASAETVFKLRYITLYHVLSSLEKLRNQYEKELGMASRSLLAAMLDHPVSAEIRSGEARHFRNTLIHYTPAEHLVSKLSMTAPYYGLVEACFPARDFPSLQTAVAEHTGRMAALMDQWSGT
ncbi:hypothetical protein ACFVDT_02415 [Streptomyces sp. NPDC057699]|uniref:hypothetical protein n=1 Tax=Streptomyces sp. NPDC057699 TaxID=3346220 RepID=UPI00367A944D